MPAVTCSSEAGHWVAFACHFVDPRECQEKTNDIANISFKLAQPLIVDKYANHKSTGAFIIVDESTFHTVGAGMIDSFN